MDKELLFKSRLPEREVEVPGVGTFRVRGLTRAEIKVIGEASERGKDMEPWTLATCILDPEDLTEEDAARWLAVAPFGEIEQLTQAINELSGISKYAGKEATKSLHGEPGTGV